MYFFEGDFRLDINMESFYVRSECIYFINPGELHSIITEKSGSPGEDAIVFSPNILSFDSYDATQMRLIHPIQKGKMLFPRCLLPEHPAFTPVRNAFMDIMQSFGQPLCDDSPLEMGAVTDDLTCQLYIKSSLLRILAILSSYHLFVPTEHNYDRRVECIKTVLTYIKENYMEKIYIRDLAELANMNEQYFCRFFKKAIGRPPMEYITEYRMKQAIRLLEETDLPVMDVCLESGYNNLGNFLKEFRKHTQTTPLQYRKQKLSKQKVKIP